MRIVIFTVCRSASNASGALSIQDAITNISMRNLPGRLQGSIATRLYFSAEEEGKYSGCLRMIDPDGRELFRSPIELDVPISESDVTGVYMDTVGAIEITLRKTGEYQFHIGNPEGELFIFPLYVSQKSEP
jgi:hypothetical protein